MKRWACFSLYCFMTRARASLLKPLGFGFFNSMSMGLPWSGVVE